MGGHSTAYFLGAGASADAGVPLTNTLLQRISNNIRQKRRYALLGRFIETFGYRYRQNPNATLRPPIVDVISFLDSSIRQSRPLDRFFTVDKLRKIRTQLTLELSNVVGGGVSRGTKVKMPPDALDQPGARGRRIAKYFQRFVRGLRPRDRSVSAPLDEGDAIITTNYDTNIDVALYELVYWEESEGDSSYSEVWDVYLGSDFRDPYNDADALYYSDSVVDLLKLHGSLNWLYCPRCSRIYVAAFGYNVRFLGKRDQSEKTCHCGYTGLEPVLIAPSNFQELENPHLLSVWMNAYHVLENADTWVFVGYSLPPEDLAVRSLLYRAWNAYQNINGIAPKMTVVCPESSISDLKKRYMGLFGRTVKFDGRRFSDFVYDR